MGLPSSLLSFEAEMEFLEQAMDSATGKRMFFRDQGYAESFRMRCYAARKLHRQENSKIHDPGTKMHGKSEYDPLRLTIKAAAAEDQGWWVYARQNKLNLDRVEDIPEEEADGDALTG